MAFQSRLPCTTCWSGMTKSIFRRPCGDALVADDKSIGRSSIPDWALLIQAALHARFLLAAGHRARAPAGDAKQRMHRGADGGAAAAHVGQDQDRFVHRHSPSVAAGTMSGALFGSR